MESPCECVIESPGSTSHRDRVLFPVIILDYSTGKQILFYWLWDRFIIAEAAFNIVRCNGSKFTISAGRFKVIFRLESVHVITPAFRISLHPGFFENGVTTFNFMAFATSPLPRFYYAIVLFTIGIEKGTFSVLV